MSLLFHYLFYLIIGRWSVEIYSSSMKTDKLYSATLQGNYVEFYCQEIFYTMRFERWYIPNKLIKTYKYSTIIDENAPEKLKAKCAVRVVFPDFGPWFLNSKDKKKHMLNVYLDVLNVKVDKHATLLTKY